MIGDDADGSDGGAVARLRASVERLTGAMQRRLQTELDKSVPHVAARYSPITIILLFYFLIKTSESLENESRYIV